MNGVSRVGWGHGDFCMSRIAAGWRLAGRANDDFVATCDVGPVCVVPLDRGVVMHGQINPASQVRTKLKGSPAHAHGPGSWAREQDGRSQSPDFFKIWRFKPQRN